MKVYASENLQILKAEGDLPNLMTSDQFKQHRLDRALNQKQWASVLGVSYSSVTKWETDPNAKIPPYVEKLVKALSRDLGEFQIKGLTKEQQAKLAAKLAEKGKTLDEYVADLLKAALMITLFLSFIAWLTHSPMDCSGAALAQAAGTGCVWFGKGLAWLVGGMWELGGQMLASL